MNLNGKVELYFDYVRMGENISRQSKKSTKQQVTIISNYTYNNCKILLSYITSNL